MPTGQLPSFWHFIHANDTRICAVDNFKLIYRLLLSQEGSVRLHSIDPGKDKVEASDHKDEVNHAK